MRKRSRWAARLWRSVLRAPGDLWWEIMWRVHPKHRYNIVRTGLPPAYYDEHHKTEMRLDERDQEMLMRLVKIRRGLWH